MMSNHRLRRRFQAARPLCQRVEDNAFHLGACLDLPRTMPQQSAIGCAAENPHFNFVTEQIADKSRQGFCSELRETPARWFGIGQS
jgi:hypothetical protein